VGGVLTGRGADIIIIDDPLKPEEALSQAQRQAANEWYDHTLYSRLNDKLSGAIVLIMHRLHEDDLAGHVLAQEDWEVVRLPAIAYENELHRVETVFGRQSFGRKAGEVLHPEREPQEMLAQLRRTIGTYNFSGQYQQAPSPLGGGMIKAGWFKSYLLTERPAACPRRTFPSTSLEVRRARHLIGAVSISNSSWQGAPRCVPAGSGGRSSAYRCAI